MNSADTWSNQTWDKPAAPYCHHLLTPLLIDGAIKFCPPSERPSAPAMIAAEVINIHVRKTGTTPGAYRQDLPCTTIPAKSTERPGEPCFRFISLLACTFERIPPAPQHKSNNHHRQTAGNIHNPALTLKAIMAIVEPRSNYPLPGQHTLLFNYSSLIKYLASMASPFYVEHLNDLIEKLGPALAWLNGSPHTDCTGSPAFAFGHA
jgi:hypothetical protein